MNDNTRGILYMVLAMATMLTSDVVVKAVAQQIPVFQVIFIRHIFMTIGLAVLVWRDGALGWRPEAGEAGLIGLRSLAECGVIGFYMIALTLMPMGMATAIFQLQPLAVTLAAAVFLAQPIGPRRMMAIVVGFGGVLLIARPGTDAFGPGAALVLLAVVSVCLRDISTRKLGANVPATVLAFVGSVALLVLSGAVMLFERNWVPVSAAQLGLIFTGAVFLLVGYLAMVFAMRFGDIAAISPFRYVSLVFGILYGFLFFGEVPQPLMLAGAAIIVASGVYTFMREQALRARAS